MDSQPIQICGYGDIPVNSLVGGKWHENVIKDVPGLGMNLFSVRSATKKDFNKTFIDDQVKIIDGKRTVTTGTSLSENLYYLNIKHASVNDYSPISAMIALTDNKPRPILV